MTEARGAEGATRCDRARCGRACRGSVARARDNEGMRAMGTISRDAARGLTRAKTRVDSIARARDFSRGDGA